jgi:hypothetical protein
MTPPAIYPLSPPQELKTRVDLVYVAPPWGGWGVKTDETP